MPRCLSCHATPTSTTNEKKNVRSQACCSLRCFLTLSHALSIATLISLLDLPWPSLHGSNVNDDQRCLGYWLAAVETARRSCQLRFGGSLVQLGNLSVVAMDVADITMSAPSLSIRISREEGAELGLTR
ncbi:hypothetical protein G7K_2015-t1 [Saitoella complicata NRRL Y-17804]|uniref:Uncharacterized protein n=1 Tax=Saitoella complicata (strain BCRC 22490 / CBS 7301 / JCM 7358 / NBRC 10748 / NRRL Y-17804) TaxID=698492 RepID=A0A0E9ND83_SAICN|nr:hypothetical protein G7K_2015-t1 [Saitoella complicata NRRL Y-17804]